jgi:outer membrane cobalamin receptor
MTQLRKITANIYHKFNDNWKTSTSITQIKSRRDESVSGVTTIGDTYKRTNLTLLNNLKVDGAIMTVGLSAMDDENTASNLKHSSKDVFIDWQKNINNLDLNIGFRHINHNKFSDHIIYNSGLAKY